VVKNYQARTVPIAVIVSGELADYKAQSNPNGFVFPSVTGTPLRNGNWRHDVFDSTVEALGLKATPWMFRPCDSQAGAAADWSELDNLAVVFTDANNVRWRRVGTQAPERE
jgi:hypothetical protein